jgi:hypothetical protein
MMSQPTWRTPETVPELRELAPNDPAVLALGRELEAAEPLPPPPATAAWSEDSGDPLADLGCGYSAHEANAILRAAAPPSPMAELKARVDALERALERRSLWSRLSSLFRRRRAGD